MFGTTAHPRAGRGMEAFLTMSNQQSYPHPLGVSFVDDGVNVAIYSRDDSKLRNHQSKVAECTFEVIP